ncbi:uncharacterized protein F5891DRAFT_975337 [Suillus fuscotomentosus]|uniref:HAT C-terminal dimerisation domain-containing protein n=1 Tax=Suillus fuscotomentosus TaxID=1912939 RepID=A0AAD4EI79_9AGAM|nr:uncharacterized protein F5891DRAFT_975337 [Suillus fuscotomentosus]KAG1906557.1 hypothetical protein F5891DRAFT_975337 [Suillus fuscotomentosus]
MQLSTKIPGSAIAVEQVFSGGHNTVSLQRASLKPKTIRILMLVKLGQTDTGLSFEAINGDEKMKNILGQDFSAEAAGLFWKGKGKEDISLPMDDKDHVNDRDCADVENNKGGDSGQIVDEEINQSEHNDFSMDDTGIPFTYHNNPDWDWPDWDNQNDLSGPSPLQFPQLQASSSNSLVIVQPFSNFQLPVSNN